VGLKGNSPNAHPNDYEIPHLTFHVPLTTLFSSQVELLAHMY